MTVLFKEVETEVVEPSEGERLWLLVVAVLERGRYAGDIPEQGMSMKLSSTIWETHSKS